MKEAKINLLMSLQNKVDTIGTYFILLMGLILTLLLINTLRTKNRNFMLMLTLIYMGFVIYH